MSGECLCEFVADASGHNAANAYLLALVCHYAYPNTLGVEDYDDDAAFERAFRSHFASWGITDSDDFRFVYERGFPDAGYDTEAMVLRLGDACIAVMRGSESANPLWHPESWLQDWIRTDLNPFLDDAPELGCEVKIHRGFYQASRAVREGLSDAIGELGGFSGKRLWLTGNSLGGALANLSAAWLARNGRAVQGVYTYAAPRCGNCAFKTVYEDELGIRCQRYVNEDDLVPHLPPKRFGFAHAGVTNTIREDGSGIALNTDEPVHSGSLWSHLQRVYVERLYGTLDEDLGARVPPPPTDD